MSDVSHRFAIDMRSKRLRVLPNRRNERVETRLQPSAFLYPPPLPNTTTSKAASMVSSKVHSKDVYRLFLQGVLSRRVMSDRVAKSLFKACVDAIGSTSFLQCS